MDLIQGTECIQNTSKLSLKEILYGRKIGHNFCNIYDTKQTIPEKIINSASRYLYSHDETEVLNAGKLNSQVYVMSYCTKCGCQIRKNPNDNQNNQQQTKE
jgi:hypothetical protein